MSQNTTATGSQTQVRHSHQRTNTVCNPFTKLDAQITEVSQNVWPNQPYVLTVPSEKPYRLQPARWWLNTPFSRKEEQLQYASLLTHQGTDESLLRVDGSRIEEDGSLIIHAPASPRSEKTSRPQTPVDNMPKKKISLKDYKQKDRSAAQTPERPSTSTDMRKQAIKSHKEEQDVVRQTTTTKKESDVRPERVPAPIPTTTPALSPRRDEPVSQSSAATQKDKDTQRPTKKRRLSEENPKLITPKTVKTERDPVIKKSLPQLLSPDMPSTKKKEKSRGLPSLLSPKLPPSLEKAVAVPARTDEVRAILKTLDSPVRLNEKKKEESTANRVRSESQTSARPGTPGIRISSPGLKAVGTPISKPTTNPIARVASPKPRQRHTIVLKYGKRNVKRVQALLKFKPRPQKQPVNQAEPDRPSTSKQPARQDPPPTARKRPAENADSMAIKKPRLASQDSERLDRPSTPKPDISSHSPLPNAKSKTAFSTPRKDAGQLRSATMQRVASTDTIEAKTPQESGRLSTPVAQQPHRKNSPAPGSTPAKTDAHSAWNELQERIFQLGRSLKKEGSQLASESDSKSKQLGVVLLIEALLCFMIRSAAQGQMHTRDPFYDSIIPYFNMVYAQSRPFKHLHGLTVLLGAVIRQHMHQEHLKRLAKHTYFDDPVSAPTPGSDGATKGNDDVNKRQKSLTELRDELVSNANHLKTAWLEGSKQLSWSMIEDQYPSTWMHKAEGYSVRNPDRLNPKDIGTDYYLPLDVSSSCFEATNFALEFLREWAMIEAVPWKARIQL